MRVSKLGFAAFAIAFATFASAPATAATISLQGALPLAAGDANATHSLAIHLPVSVTISIRSYGFGGSANAPGGVNLAGVAIPAGGFDPYLSLFSGIDTSATFIASNDDGACPPGATDGGTCRDPVLMRSLAAGDYTLVLGAFSNVSLAENLGTGTLGDGFAGLGNFDPARSTAYALDVHLSPWFTSVGAATFVAGWHGSYNALAAGSPGPSLSIAGTLPAGVTFTPETGQLAGVPSAAGIYQVSLTATNGTPPDAVQPFFLSVLTSGGDEDADGIPNGVEVAESRDPVTKDNDLFSTGAASARLFAMQQYRDFLNREGDSPGIAGWASLVEAGTYTHLQVIDAFLSSEEFAGFVSPVVRLYFATFLRVPDYAGLTFNAGLVRNGTVTLAQLADFFVASPEFAATYGALDNAAFVTLLYTNVLGRAPDPAGLSGWVGLLEGGYTRGQVLLGFSDSVEYQASMAHKVFVTMMYAGMLRRTPEPDGFNGWVAFLDAGTFTREQVINGFFLSTEYRGRFLP